MTALQARRLARMKALALALLLLAAGVYALARWRQWQPGAPSAWGYVAAFAEAAMVGAIADWFAVVALFRHPLGLPIAHTAIVPRNKDRLGASLADFLSDHFLSASQVLPRLQTLDIVTRLAAWLAHAQRAQTLARHLGGLARWGVDALDDPKVRQFVQALALRGLGQLDLARLTGQLLDSLTRDDQHQQVLSLALDKLGDLLDDAALQEAVAQAIAQEVKVLKAVGLDQVAAQWATRKLLAAVARTLADMAARPEHPLRHQFDGFVTGWVQRLQNDPALQRQADQLRQRLLEHPALTPYLQQLSNQWLAWLRDDLSRDDSRLHQHLQTALQALGQRLQADAAMRDWLQRQLLAFAPALLQRYRGDIRNYIVTRVQAWDAQDLTRELEAHVGRDLQFIRINGTLVGGLTGLCIYAFTQWLLR